MGLAQINPTVGDFEANKEKILKFIRDAEAQGMDLVIFPELSISGYPVWDLANKRTFVDAGYDVIRGICRETKSLNVTSVVGFIDYGKKRNGKNFNALAVLQKGKILLIQHKMLLPTYDVFLEEIFFEAGHANRTFTLNGIRFGTSICEDIWDDAYKVKPLKLLKKQGAQIVINVSASPYHKHVPLIRDSLIRKKAKANEVWLAYVNQVGGQDDLVFDGRSLVSDPSGKVIARGKAFSEELVSVKISINEKKQITAPFPSHDQNQIANLYEALVCGVGDYVRKNKFQKVVIGLSGGIDSALVAALAKDALGSGSVIGVTMPSQYSSAGSYEDSEELAKNLGIEFRKQSIEALFDKFIDQVTARKKERGGNLPSISLANENLQARLRALELMYISNDENCLLLSTGNKSELAMGYCTLYGDMCGGLAVLGDVFKTDVYRIARYRNELSHSIPEATLTKAPSAELRPNQKDQDSLPPYEQLDRVLELYIERDMNEKEIIKTVAKEGISTDTVRDIIRRLEHNEYKRRQTPPIIRVSEKAWFGRRMPITNRFFQ